MKRLFDMIFVILILIPAVPIMLFSAVLIRVSMGAPIVFKQVRPGKDERLFSIYKFRTMNDKKGEDGRLLPDQERMTFIGSWIRKLSIDELPQLVNVLKGEMSFVGPRPLLVEYLPLYNSEQKRRHEVLPGITGWAQINGRNAITWEEKFKLDIWYVENRSMLLDLKIIWLTIVKVLRRTNVSAQSHVTMPKFTGNN